MEQRSRGELVAVGCRILAERFAGAEFAYLSGSLVRGVGTASSDLDLVVIYHDLPRAWRESFEYEGWPVEAFVHDPETLRHVMAEVDCRSGCPLMPHMVVTGVAIPASCELSDRLRGLAQGLLDAGPPALSDEERPFRRYMLTDALDDLADARSHGEAVATAAQLYGQVGDTFLRARGLWSGKGKWMPRLLREADAGFADRWERAFGAVWGGGGASAVEAVVEEALAPIGGLFRFAEGFRRDAPTEWKTRPAAGSVRRE